MIGIIAKRGGENDNIWKNWGGSLHPEEMDPKARVYPSPEDRELGVTPPSPAGERDIRTGKGIVWS